MIIFSQNYEMLEVTQLFYEKHYAYKHNIPVWLRILPIEAFKFFCGWNLYGYDKKGVKVLIGTFDEECEVIQEMVRLNQTKEYVKVVSGIDF